MHPILSCATRVAPVHPGFTRSLITFTLRQSYRLATLPATAKRTLITITNHHKPPTFAFAFDIDGVLLHVTQPIPGATETLQFLNDHNIPFILLTNGGGKLEADRVADLQSKLKVNLSTQNFVQSHTPFKDLVTEKTGLKDKTVLVTGSDSAKCRAIAEDYGFTSVVTPADILAALPTIFPFDPLLKQVYATTYRPLPKPLYDPTNPTADALKIDAIFVFNDPRDWSVDIQIIADILQSHAGVIGTFSPTNGDLSLPNNGWQADGQPAIYFSNPDLLWSAHFHQPRLGQGAFQASLNGVWKALTKGQELKSTIIGKPHQLTYEYAERILNQHRAALPGVTAADGSLRNVYMVGDNPASDIAGANGFKSKDGSKWYSLLVRTGVWNEARGPPEHTPTAIVSDVREAVRWALKKEGMSGL